MAQRAGKWTERALRGFTVGDDKRLHVAPEAFLDTRETLACLARGESKRPVAAETGISRSTLTRLYEAVDRRAMYFEGTHDDGRVEHALAELGGLPEIDRPADDGNLREVGRDSVQEEVTE